MNSVILILLLLLLYYYYIYYYFGLLTKGAKETIFLYFIYLEKNNDRNEIFTTFL